VNNFYLVGEPQLFPSGVQLSRDAAFGISGLGREGKTASLPRSFCPEVWVYNFVFASL
jgi:hypothetical protein